MKKQLKKAKSLVKKSIDTMSNDGPQVFAKRSAKFIYYKSLPDQRKTPYRDVLFINGCTLPHPERYRVDHQIEQLRAGGMTADKVFYEELSMDMLKYYRGFVFFRCPVTETVREFIELAKIYNKTCFFDVDDLVIDQKYTDQIEYVQKMPASDKALYNSGVDRMKETFELCDYVITTTETLQRELESYGKEVFINRNVASDEMVGRSADALREVERDESKVVIGYFSGSITHNENFEMVLPSIVKLLKKYDNLYLKIVGILDIPAELEPFRERIIAIDFMSWRTMPREIATCDINIAPLIDTVFNEAKSENKWTEASLVKVVTVASNIGAFKKAITHKKTGVLVQDDAWYDELDKLIKNSAQREELALAAYKEVLGKSTIQTTSQLTHYIRSKLARNIGFILPSTDISGGINVILKHAEILKKHGWDVTLIDAIGRRDHKRSQKQYQYRNNIEGFNVVTMYKTNLDATFDSLVATLWSTLKYVKKHPNVKNKLYFVQNLETDFYVHGQTIPRVEANATYGDETDVKYITMSLWCQKWLKERFGQDSKYVSNGIDLEYYPQKERAFQKDKKVKILIEGDSKSEYKNTDEAFRIVEKLDPAQYEISYLSYRKEPKDWYRVDHFYNRIAPEKVGEVYASCDILLKTSLLESFSYPPLEMMATGGVSVVVPNDGNVEYVKNGYNCLFYEAGDIESGVNKISQLVDNKKLRDDLIKNGLETARNYKWEQHEKNIVKVYE